MIPKAVIFDLGNVLLEFDYAISIRKLTRLSRATEDEWHGLINQSPLLYEYETGLLSCDEFFSRAKAASGFTGDSGEFFSHFGDIFSPIPEMIAFNADLRAAGVPTYIFSNTNEAAIRHIRQTFPFFRDFTGYFLSYEERLMKPHPDLYSRIEGRLGLPASALVYIDDRLENVLAGRERGWKVVHHQEPAQTIASVDAFFKVRELV